MRTVPATWSWTRDGRAVIELADGTQASVPLGSPDLACARLGDRLVVDLEEPADGVVIRRAVLVERTAGPAAGPQRAEAAALAPCEGGLRPGRYEVVDEEFFENLRARSADPA